MHLDEYDDNFFFLDRDHHIYICMVLVVSLILVLYFTT